jgi:hypothetical protein
MKNRECRIVCDILPLYVENVISDDTRQFVDEHLSQCAECKKELELLKTEIPFEKNTQEIDSPVKVMKKIGSSIKKKRVFTGVISAIISALVVILSFAYLTLPEYLPYTEAFNIITAHENNGNVTLSFTGEYELSQKEQGVYAISLYNTIWNKLFDTMQKQVITVNPNGEEVNTIYYVSNGGQEDKVIYGKNLIADGGVMTLPRLFLNYYIAIAIFIAFVLTVLLLLFRKKQKIKKVIVEILFAPISYIVSHIMITGFNATSYSATRDFYLILLLAIPLYFLLYLLYKKKTNLGVEYFEG